MRVVQRPTIGDATGCCGHVTIHGEDGMAESELLHAYGYLTQPEIRFLDAAVERLIPTDELGPGGKEAGVTCYIDRQLSSAWGTHGRNYRSGPWLEGTPEQGFQSRLTPQEIYRIGIQEINAVCRAKYERPFDQLQPAEAGRGAEGAREGRSRAAVAVLEALLRSPLAQHRGRLLRRPDVRRQPRQGGMEAPGISRRALRRLQGPPRQARARTAPSRSASSTSR